MSIQSRARSRSGVNSEFITGIAGFKQSESDLLLKFLVDHVVMDHDFQAKVQWEANSVVIFNGRTTIRKSVVALDFNSMAY